ncbi:MAG: flagellar hook-associated protein FlgK [Betaproteobacteria bacterium]|nr:flagellar hook-associated protein FlgK [Betaproteobacteria bacterium]
MGTSIFGIGLSGLNAAQAGLTTTGHNIANVNTPGYTRQQLVQSARAPQFTGAGYFGQGTNADTVRRIYSEFLASQVRQTQASASELAVREARLIQLDNLFGDSVSSLAPALDDFFAGVNAVAARPADVPARQTMLNAAQALVSRFNQLGEQLAEMRGGTNTQIEATVGSINSYSRQIAELNHRIAESIGVAGDHLPANDLLDQRDALVQELNQQIGATGVLQSDGALNVFLSNGQALVVGETSYALRAQRSSANPVDVTVGLDTPGGLVPFRTQDLAGGALGGLLRYRDGELTLGENALGRIALVTAQAFNDQHGLGQDLTGALGGAFFGVPSARATTLSGTATLAATVTDPGALSTSDYQLAYDGANYRLTRLQDGSTQTFATLPQTVDGVSIAVGSGTPVAGDRFLIQPTRSAAVDLRLALGDPARIAVAAPIRTGAATANTGSGTISAGSVDASYPATPLAAPVTLSFATPATTFSTTVAVEVTIGTTTTAYAAGAPIPYAAGATVAFGGLRFTLGGVPAGGDQFTVRPNTNGAGDNRNALLLGGLSTRQLVANGTTTLHGAYGQLVSTVGSATHEIGIESAAQARLLAQAQDTQASVSGVNLDEEAANLQRYQQAYQASGKVMAIAASLFQTVLGIFGN